ncbi:MAG: 23S rRNA (guanosine(2251)-2'-O)-methyltransferase RlmB [Rhodovibrionaceae bacterium]
MSSKRKTRRLPASRERRPAAGKQATGQWLWGAHAVLAALANPQRLPARLILTPEAAQRHAAELHPLLAERPELRPESLGREAFAKLLPEGAVHQGIALATPALPQPGLEELLHGNAGRASVVIVLDQVTDPHNVGAILRSAAVFGADALITTERHAPQENGVLAKSASGALEHLPYIRVTNLARGLEALKAAEYWCLGFASEAAEALGGFAAPPRTALVLGAEGLGLRRLTREACDLLVRLPVRGAIRDLNVSNAAAVGLYELLGRSSKGET